MRVLALVSGGKDSCFSILKCIAHGHTVVALAHITPPRIEADSFMFQSVGSDAVPLIAEALDLPLFTAPTSARAVIQTLAYAPDVNDEVEDLVKLLRKVKQAVPEVEAVCAGALWSDYQRFRVESAAFRTGLLSLAYLWRRNQRELLDEMLSAGVEAVLVKVAGIGLDSSHLGKTLGEVRPHLLDLENRYGSHVCGEGGEYETLVLFMPLFKKRIVLDKVEVVLHQEDDIAPVSYLKIMECHLEECRDAAMPDLDCLVPPVPAPLRASGNLKELERRKPSDSIESSKVQIMSEGARLSPEFMATGGRLRTPSRSQVTVSSSFAHGFSLSAKSGADGVLEAAHALRTELQNTGFSLGDVLYVWLYLESVSGTSYAEANRAYCSVFGIRECVPPPSRACVAMSTLNHPVALEVIARRNRRDDSSDSRTLHVQSLSEWAPPCIGPYAQVVEDLGITFVSGALAMHAPNASVPSDLGAGGEMRGCLFNIKRTLEATRTSFENLKFFVAYITSDRVFQEVQAAFDDFMNEQQCILAVVPCSGLPKGALVEVRAIGSRREIESENMVMSAERDLDMENEKCNSGVEVDFFICGSLTFARVGISSTLGESECSKGFLKTVTMIEKKLDATLIASQVYITSSSVECELPQSLNLLMSTWIPGKLRLLGVLTFTSDIGT